MEWYAWIVLLWVVYILVQLGRLAFGDADLSLLWKETFGKKPAVLKGQVVWITGASSGIGEHLAYELAQAGCRLVLSARREEELERVKKQCLLRGSIKEEDVLVLPLDMLRCDTHKPAVEHVVNYFKQIDVLVNNAGRTQRGETIRTDVDVQREILELNVLGPISLTTAVLPRMVEQQRGHLVVVSSLASKMGLPMSATYCASKAAVNRWFESVCVEHTTDHIDVTLILPGPVFSDLFEAAFTEQAGRIHGQPAKPTDKRMATARCAELAAVAIANRVSEAWVAQQPYLAMFYLAQYMPDISRW
ncbi:hypothetical protein NP493_126g08024 [Ridgeia piscesae]|uniref:Ketoreductase domain-containing protein n=1 Tax=Ridgeia piscesae TaxID=27915 RepID=A0AAD9P5Y8_RIDPI|nr:hypothetical protein NP493_126g08024 [Ridgeia piscesae]